MSDFFRAWLITRVGFAMVTMALLLIGCKPQPAESVTQQSRDLREVLYVIPSDALRHRARAGEMDIEKVRDRSEAFVQSTYTTRSRPGYSARALSDDVFSFLLRYGVMLARCDIAFRWPASDRPVGDVTISGEFRVASIRDAFPSKDSSWVAEAAWEAVPRQGNFSLTVPAQAVTGSSKKVLDNLVTQHVESLLSRNIESDLHKLLVMDGVARFQSRRAVYGVGECMPEACPSEDGIDSLAILRVAQTMQDDKHLPRYLAGATAEEQKAIAKLARMLCGMMLPRDWHSVMRERLKARPVYISKTTVVLQLATGKKEYTVTRNAFTDESDAFLSRFEDRVVEFVAKLNTARLTAAHVDVDEAEKTALPPTDESECGKCLFRGEFTCDSEGNIVCPKCGALEASSRSEPDKATPLL